MKRYSGAPKMSGAVVTITEGKDVRALDPRLDLANHSPTGFAWGYAGSGPAQLALALAADATGCDDRALAVYQNLKHTLVARWPQDAPWEIAQAEILDRVALIERALAAPNALTGGQGFV